MAPIADEPVSTTESRQRRGRRDSETSEDDTTAPGQSVRPDEPLDASPWLIVMSGRSMGRMSKLELGEFALGRAPSCEIPLEDEGVSRHHAMLRLSDTGATIVDLGSRNGTFVDENRIGNHPVPVGPGTRIRLGGATILKIGSAEELEQQVLVRLYRSATRDGLTNLFNRRFFSEALEQEVAWHRRHDQALSLILLDIDLFKQVNTNWGHPAGDEVLRDLAGRLQQGVRSEDVVARFGGEEFAIILRHTDLDQAMLLAERLRRRIESTPFSTAKASIPVTASFGVAADSGAELGTRTLLAEADRHLRHAKATGRNGVVAVIEAS